jgi:predicted transcriptional regulator YheO
MFSKRDLDLFSRLAKGLAAQFGQNCEVVIHDLTTGDHDSSIVIIENGQVSGRKVGDGPSRAVLDAILGGKTSEDHLSYLTKTEDGKILKSSSVYIRDDTGAIVGLFGINYDISLCWPWRTPCRVSPHPMQRRKNRIASPECQRPFG